MNIAIGVRFAKKSPLPGRLPALETNPPLPPPCQRGKKKQNPLGPAGAHRLFIPP